MLKKTINYTDFNGEQQSEDFYFNLGKGELTELALSENSDQDLATQLRTISESGDAKKIIAVFKDIVRKAYGQKSEDGKRFIKSEELSKEFEQTAAYDAFFAELVTDADAAVNFIRGIVPADLSERLDKVETKSISQEAAQADNSINVQTNESAQAPQLSQEQIAAFIRDNPDAYRNLAK